LKEISIRSWAELRSKTPLKTHTACRIWLLFNKDRCKKCRIFFEKLLKLTSFYVGVGKNMYSK
jgi:hypothetical protein